MKTLTIIAITLCSLALVVAVVEFGYIVVSAIVEHVAWRKWMNEIRKTINK